MAIIGTLPSQILNGQLVDAPPVMADLNFIVNQVNANVPALIPASTPIVNVTSVGGTANSITLTPSPAISSYTALQRFQFIAGGSNTGNVLINVSGLGNKSLLWADGTVMTGFEIISGDPVDICYNGSFFVPMWPVGPSGIQTATAGLTFGGGATGMTFSTNTVTYYKLGRVLYYIVALVLTAKGSSTGDALITGLPYAPNASWGIGVNQVGGGLYTSSVNFTNGYLASFLSAGISSVALVNVPSGGGAATFLSNANFANNSQVYVSGSYIV